MTNQHTHKYLRIHREPITGRYGSIDICLCGATKLNANRGGEVLNRVNTLNASI
jgi:hypothetical protein